VEAEDRINKINRKKSLATQPVKKEEKKQQDSNDSNYKPTLKDIFNQANS